VSAQVQLGLLAQLAVGWVGGWSFVAGEWRLVVEWQAVVRVKMQQVVVQMKGRVWMRVQQCSEGRKKEKKEKGEKGVY
jgi:hypothetical protein